MSSPRKPTDKPLTPGEAWQPFTPRGIAAFAFATRTRLFLAQLATAGIVAIAVVWFLSETWFPVVTEAIQKLPETGEIRGAALSYSGTSPVRLAENRRLAIVVDPERTGAAGHVADLEMTFENTRLALCGPLGCYHVPYVRGYQFALNRPELEPAWGAWRGPFLGVAAIGTLLWLFVTWWVLALLYSPLVRIIAFYGDRTITWGGAWRLSAAALLPGAWIVALALALYGYGAVDLLRFALHFAVHFAAGLIFVITSALFLPKFPARSGRNPFTTGS